MVIARWARGRAAPARVAGRVPGPAGPEPQGSAHDFAMLSAALVDSSGFCLINRRARAAALEEHTLCLCLYQDT